MSSTWVRHLYGLVDWPNDMEMQMTGMKPKDTIELKEVQLVESYPPEDTLWSENELYHYLLQPEEEHSDQPKKESHR